MSLNVVIFSPGLFYVTQTSMKVFSNYNMPQLSLPLRHLWLLAFISHTPMTATDYPPMIDPMCVMAATISNIKMSSIYIILISIV